MGEGEGEGGTRILMGSPDFWKWYGRVSFPSTYDPMTELRTR
ncbi:MAG: hypothetical protein SFY66_01945 [Oculatellaceae cyanobacterium bins.114]|nr:hypothetical protein [Oculatellaceae cyanobacterium bins.114]